MQLTERIVGINVGVGDVPAPYGGVHAATEALLPCGADGQAQHRTHMGPERVHRLHV